MATCITRRNMRTAERNWVGNPASHALHIAQFMAIHEAEKARKDMAKSQYGEWLWTDNRIIDRCDEIVWQMTGEWKARRGSAPVNRSRFWSSVVNGVRGASIVLNEYGVSSLTDLGELNDSHYRTVLTKVEDSIREISAAKRTIRIHPVLGSKVLHHFFPSIVPVYDV